MLADPHICCFLAKQYAWEKMRSIQSFRYSSSSYHYIYMWEILNSPLLLQNLCPRIGNLCSEGGCYYQLQITANWISPLIRCAVNRCADQRSESRETTSVRPAHKLGKHKRGQQETYRQIRELCLSVHWMSTILNGMFTAELINWI